MILIRPLTDDDIADMQTWSYPPPYDLYSLSYIPPDEALEFFKDPGNGYFGLYSPAGELLGFCNFGYDARVEGFDYFEEALDIGIGMRPELIGMSQGATYARRVFEEAEKRFPGLPLRVTIANFNQRAQRVCLKNGFRNIARFKRPSDGRDFAVLLRQPPASRVPNRNS